jgi:hypothetical protein
MTDTASINSDTPTSALQPQPAPVAPLPLPLTVRDDPAEIQALWALTTQQRIDAMWAGRLMLSQLCEWSARRPSQVPVLGGEFAWIVMRTPEWAEATELPRDNIIHLPERKDRRAAA